MILVISVLPCLTVKYLHMAKKNGAKAWRVFAKSLPLQRFNKAIDCLTKKLDNKMKKLVFMFVAMAAVSFASCGGNENKGAAADSTSTDSAAAVAPADSVPADSNATAAPADSNAAAAPAATDAPAQ